MKQTNPITLGEEVVMHIDDLEEDYLAHHGIPGQKHGVRRYQNEDGSLTPEGYRHYGIDPNTDKGGDVVTARQIRRYENDTYRDNYKQLRRNNYNREQAKHLARSEATTGAINKYGLGRYSQYYRGEQRSRIGGAAGALAAAHVARNVGVDHGYSAGATTAGMAGAAVVGGLIGGRLSRGSGKYNKKNIKAVEEIEKVFTDPTLNYKSGKSSEEARSNIKKASDKIINEYAKKVEELVDNRGSISDKKKLKEFNEELRYVLQTYYTAFGPTAGAAFESKLSEKLADARRKKIFKNYKK